MLNPREACGIHHIRVWDKTKLTLKKLKLIREIHCNSFVWISINACRYWELRVENGVWPVRDHTLALGNSLSKFELSDIETLLITGLKPEWHKMIIKSMEMRVSLLIWHKILIKLVESSRCVITMYPIHWNWHDMRVYERQIHGYFGGQACTGMHSGRIKETSWH